jgi:hypothetical protein
MTSAKRLYFRRLDASLEGILATDGVTIAVKNPGNRRAGRDEISSNNPIT